MFLKKVNIKNISKKNNFENIDEDLIGHINIFIFCSYLIQKLHHNISILTGIKNNNENEMDIDNKKKESEGYIIKENLKLKSNPNFTTMGFVPLPVINNPTKPKEEYPFLQINWQGVDKISISSGQRMSYGNSKISFIYSNYNSLGSYILNDIEMEYGFPNDYSEAFKFLLNYPFGLNTSNSGSSNWVPLFFFSGKNFINTLTYRIFLGCIFGPKYSMNGLQVPFGKTQFFIYPPSTIYEEDKYSYADYWYSTALKLSIKNVYYFVASYIIWILLPAMQNSYFKFSSYSEEEIKKIEEFSLKYYDFKIFGEDSDYKKLLNYNLNFFNNERIIPLCFKVCQNTFLANFFRYKHLFDGYIKKFSVEKKLPIIFNNYLKCINYVNLANDFSSENPNELKNFIYEKPNTKADSSTLPPIDTMSEEEVLLNIIYYLLINGSSDDGAVIEKVNLIGSNSRFISYIDDDTHHEAYEQMKDIINFNGFLKMSYFLKIHYESKIGMEIIPLLDEINILFIFFEKGGTMELYQKENLWFQKWVVNQTCTPATSAMFAYELCASCEYDWFSGERPGPTQCKTNEACSKGICEKRACEDIEAGECNTQCKNCVVEPDGTKTCTSSKCSNNSKCIKQNDGETRCEGISQEEVEEYKKKCLNIEYDEISQSYVFKSYCQSTQICVGGVCKDFTNVPCDPNNSIQAQEECKICVRTTENEQEFTGYKCEKNETCNNGKCEESFFEKYKEIIIAGGTVVGILGASYLNNNINMKK